MTILERKEECVAKLLGNTGNPAEEIDPQNCLRNFKYCHASVSSIVWSIMNSSENKMTLKKRFDDEHPGQ